MQVTIDLVPENSGHRTIHLHSPCTDHKDLSNLISLTVQGDVVNSLRVEAKYYEDQRSGYDVSRGTTDEETFGPNPELPELTETDRETLRHQFAAEWDGVTQEATLRFGWGDRRREWSRVLQHGDWPKVLYMLQRGANPNDWQLSGTTLNTPLHWAAGGGAPIEIVQALIDMGGWRNVPNASGERPLDIAVRKNHRHLFKLLKPVLRHQFEDADILTIQRHFHDSLHWTTSTARHQLRRPELGALLELSEPKMHFRVPDMYGGYVYWLDTSSREPKLIFESRCRIVGGPVPRSEITVDGVTRVASVNFQ